MIIMIIMIMIYIQQQFTLPIHPLHLPYLPLQLPPAPFLFLLQGLVRS